MSTQNTVRKPNVLAPGMYKLSISLGNFVAQPHMHDFKKHRSKKQNNQNQKTRQHDKVVKPTNSNVSSSTNLDMSRSVGRLEAKSPS